MPSPRLRAAPPNDGDQGVYTRPEDEMDVARPAAQTVIRVDPSARKRGALLAWLIGIAILVLVVAIAYWQGAAGANVIPP